MNIPTSTAIIFNIDGIRIAKFKQWVNRLCPVIKAIDKGQSFICAVAHMNIAIMAGKTGKPVVEECDGGLIKMVVPVIVDGQMIGGFSGCGFVSENGEVDTFMINRTTGIEEEKLVSLSEDIPVLTQKRADEIVEFIQNRINTIIDQYQINKNQES